MALNYETEIASLRVRLKELDAERDALTDRLERLASQTSSGTNGDSAGAAVWIATIDIAVLLGVAAYSSRLSSGWRFLWNTDNLRPEKNTKGRDLPLLLTVTHRTRRQGAPLLTRGRVPLFAAWPAASL